MERNSLKLSGDCKNSKHTKKSTAWRIVASCILVLALLVGLWGAAVFSNIPFVKKWREIYIETAMTTMTHQWLATAFIPASVIDAVMNRQNEFLENNQVAQSELPEIETETAYTQETETRGDPVPMDALARMFAEIDMETVPDDFLPAEYSDFCGFQAKDIEDTGILTASGDAVWGIDIPNGILITKIYGDNYVGTLAIVNDSAQVFLGKSSLSQRGETIKEMCDGYGAILGINANGFYDPDGTSYGDSPEGLLLSESTIYNPASSDGYFQISGYDYNDYFRVGYGLNTDELRDAAQFFPIVVLNGEDATAENANAFGIQPCTCIGQTSTLKTLMLIIDGRQIGYSIGATVGDCAAIMLRYHAFNAMCMDGGSSSCMVYDGALITKPSTAMTYGRYVPSGWLVNNSNKGV